MKRIFALFIALLIVSNSQSETLIVGSDSESDFSSIQEAVDQANPGDTVFVKPGEYEGYIKIKKQLTLEGSGFDQTLLKALNSAVWIDTDSFVKIKDLAIQSEENGVFVRCDFPPNGVQIENCKITECKENGIYYFGTESLVLINTIIEKCGKAGVYMSAFNKHYSRLIVINSIIAYNKDGIIMDYSSDAGWPIYFHLKNATIIANSGYGIDNNVNASGSIINSLLSFNYRGIESNGCVHVSYSNIYKNVYKTTYGVIQGGEANLDEDPMIQENYHFLNDSPAIDAGNPIESEYDLDGTPNDLGAFGGPLGGPTGTKSRIDTSNIHYWFLK